MRRASLNRASFAEKSGSPISKVVFRSVLPVLASGPGGWLNGGLESAHLHLSEARIPGDATHGSTAIGLRGICMGYVHPDKPDIFLSYAHVDDEPDPPFPTVRAG